MIVEFPDELERAIRDSKLRDRWSKDGAMAVYTPPEGPHVVRVRKLDKPFKRDESWWTGLAVDGAAKWVSTHYSAKDAVAWAERQRLAD